MVMSQSFGTVYMKLPVSVFALIFSINASANIEKSFNILELKTQECMNLPNTHMSSIDDPWLISLDSTSRKVALLLVKDKLMSKCIESEERNYVYQLYLKYSQENDVQPIVTWLELKKNGLIEQFDTIVDKPFLNNVARLSNSRIFGAAFDVKDALNAIDN